MPELRATDAPSCVIDECGNPVFHKKTGYCSKHYTRWYRNGDPLLLRRASPTPADATEKLCSRCRKVLPVEQFDRRKGSKNRPGALKGYCRECDRVYYKEYVATETGRERTRIARAGWNNRSHDYFLNRRYGIGVEDYNALVELQGGRCAICGTDSPGGNFTKWAVDHCHGSLKVRGLLCVNCNMGIGQFGDDPARLRAAAEYIERSRAA
jgi:hypothetical protein